jgi:hypothetical protein
MLRIGSIASNRAGAEVADSRCNNTRYYGLVSFSTLCFVYYSVLPERNLVANGLVNRKAFIIYIIFF